MRPITVAVIFLCLMACFAHGLPTNQSAVGNGSATTNSTDSRVHLIKRDELIINLMRTILYVTDFPGFLDMFCGDIAGMVLGSEAASSLCQLFDDFSIMIRTGLELKSIPVGVVPLGVLTDASMFSLYGTCKIEAESIPPDVRERICTFVRRFLFTLDNTLNFLTLIGHVISLASWLA